ncbi:hypothetical protein BO71DRAFT_404520 [Aspergillus ellipticus CBS 707.79]|uniref:Uncharacterized protein n=1 Tax=Aspergillus ellipticus CBS 707.79 TaxID=1448320 RepID=A0A319CZ07_9EURO|nr:hypothetical protein BO71DRAFT_404520 [Aspergillus ellipticus CBS 707.79]
MFTFFRALGQTLGVALGGTIFANRFHVSLQAQPGLDVLHRAASAGNLSTDAVALVQLVAHLPDPAMQWDLRTVFVDSLRIVWAFCCGEGRRRRLVESRDATI